MRLFHYFNMDHCNNYEPQDSFELPINKSTKTNMPESIAHICHMINAKDYVEKCVTFVLAHLFAFAAAKLFCILSNFGLLLCCTYCLVKYGIDLIKGNGGNV